MKRIVWSALLVAASTDCRGCVASPTSASIGDAAADVATEPAPPPPPVEVQACEGPLLELIDALRSPNCAAPEREWKLAAEAHGLTIAQEATVSGDTIRFSLVNRGTKAAKIPLRHGASGPAFSALADTETKGLYELAPPVPLVDGGLPDHVETALIVLPPGGRASVHLALDRQIVSRLDRHCTDCIPPELPAEFVLYVGQLVTPLECGPPARVKIGH